MQTPRRPSQSVFPQLCVLPQLSRDVSFVTSQELEDAFPGRTAKEREDACVKDHPTTFLMGIGAPLQSGQPHDGRAPDYDDWTLNGDILFWDSVLGRTIELSSMGIRVDPAALDRQLTAAGCDDRRELPFHKMLLDGELPLTIGGGIGQSRLSMLLLGKAHIGEVQVVHLGRRDHRNLPGRGDHPAVTPGSVSEPHHRKRLPLWGKPFFVFG